MATKQVQARFALSGKEFLFTGAWLPVGEAFQVAQDAMWVFLYEMGLCRDVSMKLQSAWGKDMLKELNPAAWMPPFPPGRAVRRVAGMRGAFMGFYLGGASRARELYDDYGLVVESDGYVTVMNLRATAMAYSNAMLREWKAGQQQP